MLKIKRKVKNLIHTIKQKVTALAVRTKCQTISAQEVLTNNRGESNSVGSAVGIVISVVLGLFLLNKLLELFGVNIMVIIKSIRRRY